MADSKITALTALTAADPANDMIPIVDVSDTPPASGNTKRISINNILACSPVATLASLNVTGSSIPANGLYLPTTNTLEFAANSLAQYRIAPLGVFSWYDGAGGTRMTLNSTGLGVGVVPSAGKGALQLSSGINFPATQVASSDANTLDDYEEGTWTGTLKGGITDPTIPVTSTGQYTKIGNQVFARILFANVTTTGASGAISITGLPFANGSNRTIGSTLCDLIATFTGSPICWVGGTGTTLNFQASNSNAAASDLTHNAGTGRYFYVSITYTV